MLDRDRGRRDPVERSVTAREPLVGVFVGGSSRRMGGAPKGLLPAPDGRSLVERLRAEIEHGLPSAPIMLVGNAEAYGSLDLPALVDDPSGIGPLGGLRALLLEGRRQGRASVLALSCDLPFISCALLQRLAVEHEDALAVAPREDERWSPLTARYAMGALPALDAVLASGRRALQSIFDQLGASAIALRVDEAERAELRDWDTPADIRA
jgi:molybdenum cofactor guanylyltransferase